MLLILVSPSEILRYINPYKSWGHAGYIVANVTNVMQASNFGVCYLFNGFTLNMNILEGPLALSTASLLALSSHAASANGSSVWWFYRRMWGRSWTKYPWFYDLFNSLSELWDLPVDIIHAIANVFSGFLFFVDWMYCPFTWILSIFLWPLSWFGWWSRNFKSNMKQDSWNTETIDIKSIYHKTSYLIQLHYTQGRNWILN